MSDYLIQGETLDNLADSVRTLSGTTNEMTPDEMIATINETKSVIDSLNEHIDDKNNPHEVTAAQIGAVNKTGDTMTGNLTVEKTSYPTLSSKNTTSGRTASIVAADSGQVYLYNQKDGNNRQILFLNKEDASLGAAIQLQRQTTEKGTELFNILHTGNTDLIAPEDIGAFGIVGNIASGADLNDYLEMGSYTASSTVTETLSNAPITSGATQLIVLKTGGGTINSLLQIFSKLGVSDETLYYRKHASGSWSDWQTIATTDYAVNKAGDTMTGGLTVQASAPQIKTTSSAAGRSVEQSLWSNGTFDIINRKDTANDMVLRIHPETKNIDSALQFYRSVNGAQSNIYNILHTGNLANYIVNPNLLDNWYFGNPVNQRGVSSHAGNTYGIDRWKLLTSGGNIEITSEGLVLSGTNSRFGQPIMDPEHLSGKTLTLSFLLKNTSGASGGFGYMKRINGSWGNSGVTLSDGLFSQTFTLNEDITSLDIGMYTASNFAGSVIIEAIKLELGTQQTLAHQDADGNWVLNEVPDYSTELLKCCMSTADSSDTYANNKRTPAAIGAAPKSAGTITDTDLLAWAKARTASVCGYYSSATTTTNVPSSHSGYAYVFVSGYGGWSIMCFVPVTKKIFWNTTSGGQWVGWYEIAQLTNGALPVSQGGTGATTLTSGRALIGAGTSAVTFRAITNNTATSSAISGSTNLVTMNTLKNAINRTTSVAAADTNYTTYMARGSSLNASATTPTANGTIAWVYE